MTALGLNLFQKKQKNFVGNKNITTSIFRIQAYNSVMCKYFYTGFLNFMLKGRRLLEHTNFSPNEYEMDDKII